MFSIAAVRLTSLRALLHIERLGPGDLAAGVGGDLVDAGLGLAQQFLAAPLQGFAALVDRNRFLKRHLAVLEPLDDRFKFLDRALEAQLFDVYLGVFGHIVFPDADQSVIRRIKRSFADVLWRGFTRPSMR